MHDGPSQSPASAAPRSAWSHIVGSLRGEHYDYTSGSLPKAILLLAIPMVLEMALESLFAIVDIWWVGKLDAGWFGSTPTHGAAAAAIGSTEAIVSVVYAIAFGLGMAVTALVARRVGEKDLPGAARAGSEAIGLGLAVGLLLSIPMCVFAPELLSLMTSGNERIVEVGTGYARWLFASNVVITLLFLQNAIFRGAGDPMLALKCLTVSNGLNLILDPCFVFGLGPFPQLGVTGAAVATCTGRGIAVLYQFWLLRRGNGRVRLERLVRFDLEPMRKMIKLSLGTIGQFLIGTSSWIGLMWGVNRFGEAATAGYTIGIRILIFALLPAWGLSNAAATLVGQNLGAKQPDRAERAVWLTGAYDAAFLAVVTLVAELFAPQIVALFTVDPAIAAHAVATLRIVAAGYVFFAWGMVTVQAFNGAGDTVTPTWLHAIFFWMLQLPMAWWLAFGLDFGMSGILWMIPATESLFAVAAVLLFRRGRWKRVVV
ncbi:MAG: MATE family efflux transporter [Planctomycetes bacterium]|nr:MATE family efflux transporter [Planctomycetota bacterium]MCB9886158.1 MATE family efflux transporter [Planctomycetota bacterium]